VGHADHEAEGDAARDARLPRSAGTGEQDLLDVLAPEVVLIGDGGGVKQAALRPITGADKVARASSAVSARPKARSPSTPS
jgi:RNA polymerase sigma-70 factor (ECF subfamily)